MRFIRFFAILILFGLSFCFYTNAQIASQNWQEAKNIGSNFKAIASHPDIEVFSAPNVIMMKVAQPAEIRIFSILGKLISIQKLQPGMYEYHLDAHGIYIIKTENKSFKIAV